MAPGGRGALQKAAGQVLGWTLQAMTSVGVVMGSEVSRVLGLLFGTILNVIMSLMSVELAGFCELRGLRVLCFVFLYVCVCVHATAYMWRSEGNLWVSAISFHHVGPGNELRLSGLATSPLAH